MDDDLGIGTCAACSAREGQGIGIGGQEDGGASREYGSNDGTAVSKHSARLPCKDFSCTVIKHHRIF